MFKLLRYFSIASLAAILAAAVLLGFFYRESAETQLTKSAEENNIRLARALANTLRRDYLQLIKDAGELSVGQLKAHSEIARLHQAVREAVEGTSLVKVKVYDLKGRTIYSSEFRQIGEDKSKDAGFVAALAGDVKSVLYHRASFHAFGRTIVNRNLLASYVPVRRSGSDATEAVFELYNDVTRFLEDITRTQRNVVLGVIAVLLLLYGVLFVIVKRADDLIKRHEKEREKTEELIRHLANHDTLTTLPNRRLLDDRLNQALVQARRRKTKFAVMLIDLNGFKVINDTFGHQAGDAVLQTVAKRLSGCVRESDTVARQGGDEFVIILNDIAQRANLIKVADKILHAIAESMRIGGQQLFVGASIGISMYPDDAGEVESLLKLADGAMYRVKQAGKSGYRYCADA